MAFSTEVVGMQDLVSQITALSAAGGGDCPEYALDGLLQAIRAADPKNPGIDVMVPGSQIVLITDAGTKNPNLKDAIIAEAKAREVCIHFIYPSSCCCETGSDLYKSIAAETGGIVIDTLTDANPAATLNQFIDHYSNNPCVHTVAKVNRQARQTAVSQEYSDYQTCHAWQVSILGSYLKVVFNTNQPEVVVTKPTGDTVNVDVSLEYGVYANPEPEVGNWSACVDTGTFRYTANDHTNLDVTILYLVEQSDSSTEIDGSPEPPPACKFYTLISFFPSLLCRMSGDVHHDL